MFCLSFTTLANAPRRKSPLPGAPTRTQTACTWFLLSVWIALMIFGGISIANPPWLEELAALGKESEVENYQKYGDNELRKGNLGLAAAQYQKALDIKPNDVLVEVSLGTTYLKYGQTDQTARASYTTRGVEVLQDALKKNPSDRLRGVIHCNLGDAFERLNRPDEALEQFRQAAVYNYHPEQVYIRIGSLLMTKNHFGEAIDPFKRALAAQMDPKLAYREMLERSAEKYADHPDRLAAIDELKTGLDAPDLLAPYDTTLIRQLQQKDRSIANTHDRLAFLYASQKRYDVALVHRQKFLEIWPDNAAAIRDAEVLRKLVGK